MAEEEQPLVDPELVQGPGRRTVIVVTLLIAAAGACGLGFVVSSSAAPSHLRATKPWHGEGSEIIQESYTVKGSNVNSGNQAGDDVVIKKQIIQKIYPPPKEEKHPKPCDVVKETRDKVEFGDGSYIMYSNPQEFVGKFFGKNSIPIKDVKNLPRCLEKLWLVDRDLGGRLEDLPRTLMNLSLPGEDAPHQAMFKGDLKDLPPLLQYLDLHHTSWDITGSFLYDLLPSNLVHLDLHFAGKVTGKLFNLPSRLRYVDFYQSNGIEGGFWDLPKDLIHAEFLHSSKVKGDLKSLPKDLTHAGFGLATDVWGDIRDLPKSLTFANFGSATDVGGDIKHLPQGLTNVCFAESSKIRGDVRDLPRSLAHAMLKSAKLHGTVQDLPPHLIDACFQYSKDIKGELSDVPSNMQCTRYTPSYAPGGGFFCHPPPRRHRGGSYY